MDDLSVGATHFYSRRRQRWPWIVTVVAVLLVGAGVIAVPNFVAESVNCNESNAIATLKNISSAQAQLQAACALDVDRDGCGEYGFFGELAGSVPLRGGAVRLEPPVLDADFATVRSGCVVRNGYVFRMFLPDAGRRGVAEDARGGDVANDNGVGQDAAERHWCCYAWPVARGWTGNRVFFVDDSGNVLATNAATVPYEGEYVVMPFDAAYGAEGRMGTAIAVNTTGRDGNLWVIVS